MTLVILAAGMGSRYGGMKQIDPIDNDGNFIIDYSIYDAIKAGFNKVVFIIKEENFNDFKDTIGNRINEHIDVEYAFQRITDLPKWFKVSVERSKPWGTTQALMSIIDSVNEPFAVINSDDFYGREAFDILSHHLNTIPNLSKPQFCMVGYMLKNTVTKNGAVNRGICEINNDGLLVDIVETKGIIPIDSSVAIYSKDGSNHKLDLNKIVSMNCWGFTPEIFPYLKSEFEKFLENINDPLKDESYLTDVIDYMIKNAASDIVVYNTNSTWLGVTYPEDKPAVVAGINKFINKGVYPKHLWKEGK